MQFISSKDSWCGVTRALELLHFIDIQQNPETLCSCSHQSSEASQLQSTDIPLQPWEKHPEHQEETVAS